MVNLCHLRGGKPAQVANNDKHTVDNYNATQQHNNRRFEAVFPAYVSLQKQRLVQQAKWQLSPFFSTLTSSLTNPSTRMSSSTTLIYAILGLLRGLLSSTLMSTILLDQLFLSFLKT